MKGSNMFNKKLLVIIAAAALAAALGLAGCGGSQTASSAPASSAESASAASAAASSAASADATQSTAAATQSSAAATQSSAAAASTGAASAASTYIGDVAAKEAALAHAGIAEADTYDLKVELDTDDGRVHYDVEFKSNGMEYDYDIDAVTGEVLSYNSEVDD